MYRLHFFIFHIFFLLSAFSVVNAQELERYTYHSNHMGTQFAIILYSDNEVMAENAANAVFEFVEEINGIMSNYIADSELNQLSRLSGSNEPMIVSEPLFEVLSASKEISVLTNGAFDVTIGPLSKAWRMTRMMPKPVIPDQEELDELLQSVGYEYIQINESDRSVTLEKEGMELDLGGIAKGYVAEKAIELLVDMGFPIALVDTGGDITLGDPPPGKNSWEVAVPMKKGENEYGHIRLAIQGKTVTTSGDMFQYVVIDGKRYSHILDSSTGLGATRQLQATVISKSGMDADAYASALTLMDPVEAIELINSLEDTEAVIYMNQTDGVKEWKSSGFDRYLIE
tara:strand:+ start:4326 stop:5351 length:1026 start_codon:yes stop_codon:yes gene_type:complete